MGIKSLTLLLSKFPVSATRTTAALTWPSPPASNSFTIANFHSALLVESFWSSTTSPTAISGFSLFLLEFVACVLRKLTKYSFLQAAVNWFSKRFWCCDRHVSVSWVLIISKWLELGVLCKCRQLKCEGVSTKFTPSKSSWMYAKGLALMTHSTSVSRVLSSSKLGQLRLITFLSGLFMVWTKHS